LNRATPKDGKPLIMPGNVRAIQVVSLTDEIDELGTENRLTKLAENTGSDGEVLISVLSAAEMLGLIRNENGKLFLTEEGLKLKEVEMARVSVLLKEKVAPIEPFRTAIELASEGGSTTAREVAKTLSARGIEWHYKPELNELLVRNLLIHWAIRAGLLSYDGKDKKFSLVT
jgi:hypothetical protein